MEILNSVREHALTADEVGRKAIIDQLNHLARELETPQDCMQRILYQVCARSLRREGGLFKEYERADDIAHHTPRRPRRLRPRPVQPHRRQRATALERRARHEMRRLTAPAESPAALHGVRGRGPRGGARHVQRDDDNAYAGVPRLAECRFPQVRLPFVRRCGVDGVARKILTERGKKLRRHYAVYYGHA